jgi:hypothetical protein
MYVRISQLPITYSGEESCKTYTIDKCSSLVCWSVNTEEKSFKTYTKDKRSSLVCWSVNAGEKSFKTSFQKFKLLPENRFVPSYV